MSGLVAAEISPSWVLAIVPIAAIPALILMELLLTVPLPPYASRGTERRLIGLLRR